MGRSWGKNTLAEGIASAKALSCLTCVGKSKEVSVWSAELRTERIRGAEVRDGGVGGEGLGHRLQRTWYVMVRIGVFILRVMGRKGEFFDLCCKKDGSRYSVQK